MKRISTCRMYKLPWTSSDNPNGWLELTTHCQLKCPGCYRGLDKKVVKKYHESINELKKQVDFFVGERNVQTISLSGGEPLLYNYLEELVSYIHSKNIRIKIYTNGLALTENKLRKLKQLGATEFIIHIDKNQKRDLYASEKQLNQTRLKFCNMFRKVKGVNLGFIMPISEDNFNELWDVLRFYKNNADIVNLAVFTCYNGSINKNKNQFNKVPLKSIADRIRSVYNCNPAAYLGKIHNPELASWLFFFPLIQNKKTIGSINGKTYKAFQERYRKRHHKYFITIKGNRVKMKSLLYLMNPLKALYYGLGEDIRSQVLLIIDSPEKDKIGWNLCEGCPDPVLYHKKLIPSCLLERVKKGEKIHIK